MFHTALQKKVDRNNAARYTLPQERALIVGQQIGEPKETEQRRGGAMVQENGGEAGPNRRAERRHRPGGGAVPERGRVGPSRSLRGGPGAVDPRVESGAGVFTGSDGLSAKGRRPLVGGGRKDHPPWGCPARGDLPVYRECAQSRRPGQQGDPGDRHEVCREDPRPLWAEELRYRRGFCDEAFWFWRKNVDKLVEKE